LRRQRARSLAIGLTEYSRAERSDRLLIPVTGDLYVQDRPGEPLRQILDNAGKAPALTPAFSPDGEWVAYVQDAEVYVISSSGGVSRQVTRGARGTGKTNGLAEYIAQEELARSEGFWWSPNSRRIAFEEADETHIPLYRIIHQGKDATGEEAEEAHHYPFAGQENARVRLGVVSIEGGEPVWMDLDMGEESYLGRVLWWPDGSLGAVLLNREQTAISLLRFDPSTGARTTVLQEASEYWINLERKPIILLEDGRFLWLSERSGFRHLYLYQKDGLLLRQLTDGEWMVDAVRGVDEQGRQVYFTGNREHPTETQLYAVSLEGGDVRRITPEPGTHQVTVDAARQQFVDVYSALDTPPRVLLRSLTDGIVRHTLELPTDPRIEEFGLEPPELVTLTNREGITLYGALYRPPAQYGAGPYPTIISVYGGPGPQMVANEWDMTARLDAQYLRSLGFLVFKLDNRGSARRGLVFEGAIKHRMGTVEVDDQVDGVRWLVEQGLADPARVGVTGWSYGGYMSLMCLAKTPDIFKVAVAGAPVTSWDGYDTAYTERYMGTPQTNPAGYAEGSVLTHVEQIRGKLLLVHGMLDENVHFRHTARLINALTRARKVYDLVVFPDERHMPRHRPDRVYQNEQIIGYFQRHL
ncbi:MAG TPA: S9 family peptidase, partial [Ktedonobacterales bacterium]|nr:S9 family peptidase [Ktedonobacterales bacterium]